MTVPRPLRPLVRTRARLAGTVVVLLAVTSATGGVLWHQHRPGPAAPAAAAPPHRDVTAALAEAQRTGRDVLIDTETTGTSQTWARPDGQARSQIHALPQRSRVATGSWAPIDTTLTPRPGGTLLESKNPVFPVRFAAGHPKPGPSTSASGTGGQGGGETGDSVLAEASIAGHLITYTWPGPLPEPVVDGPRALYSEVLPGVDLLMVSRAEGGFAQLMIVKTRAAATLTAVRTPTYGLASDTALFRHDPSTGSVRVHDRRTGDEISSVPTPFGWDSAGRDVEAPPGTPASTATGTPAEVLRLSGLSGAEPGAHSAVLPTRVEGDGTGAVRLSLDAGGTGLLSAPDTAFPVFLDPALNSPKQAWTLVQKLHPNSNFLNGTNYNNGTSEARVGHEDQDNGTARSFWRMAYSSSLKGARISSAKFKVLNTHSWNCTRREHQLWATGAISSSTTWNKQPSWVKEQQRRSFAYGYNTACNDDYVDFNVLNAAQTAANAGASSVTLGMRSTSETDTLTWRKFSASTAVMEVVFNRPPNVPSSLTSTPGGACLSAGRVVAKTNLILAANSSDADGNLARLVFRFWRSTDTTKTEYPVTTTSAGRATQTIVPGKLADKGVYFWDVRAEDSGGLKSATTPATPCKLTIDASAPPAPEVTSDVFLKATPDGATWATVKFGQTGAVSFEAEGATRFEYTFEGGKLEPVTASGGKATVPALKPPHAGPNWLQVYAYDGAGNRSLVTQHITYVPPRDQPDGPHDLTGDGQPDLMWIAENGTLYNFPGSSKGDLYGGLVASYRNDKSLNPAGHWLTGTTAALISKNVDVYPGDGNTDLFARLPDGSFWLYPGDGYGSFNVDKRLRVLLPADPTLPAASTWTQLKALGDITGDQRPEVAIRSGSALWILSGYSGGAFQQATLMQNGSWARQEVVNVADVDLDGTPDLTFRNLDSGVLILRHGKPGPVAGSVDLNSLKTAAASRQGDVTYGGGWQEGSLNAVLGVADVNGDRVPDIYARIKADGSIRIYHMNSTTGGTWIPALTGNYNNVRAFG